MKTPSLSSAFVRRIVIEKIEDIGNAFAVRMY